MTADAWLADDAVQETFLRAWKYQDSFRGSGSYEGWLLRICRHTIIDLSRQRGGDRLDAGPLPHDGERLTDHRSTNHGSSLVIDEALASLPVAQREVITLCGVLGYDYESAAELLGVPVGTIRSRLSRARAGLSAALAPDAPVQTA